jgi:hypothetical protein
MKKVESFEEFGKRSIMPDQKDEGLLEFRITFTWGPLLHSPHFYSLEMRKCIFCSETVGGNI